MKIDRLIGILAILLQKDKVTAPYLAEKFEVSRRTINRDVENLCKAGIPLVTTQGKSGGISIMEGYRLDKTLLTSSDMQAVLAGIRSLDSVCGTNRYQQLMEKLSMGNSHILTSNHDILIDLSCWQKMSLAPKIELIQSLISRQVGLAFDYYGPTGEGERQIEPCKLLFKWSSWYVWGYCLSRMDFRMFKLNRMQNLRSTEEKFSPRHTPEIELDSETMFPGTLKAAAVFEPSMKWRLIEEYGLGSFEEREDGRLLFRSVFSDENSLYGFMLSFGPDARLVEPEWARQTFAGILKDMLSKYREC